MEFNCDFLLADMWRPACSYECQPILQLGSPSNLRGQHQCFGFSTSTTQALCSFSKSNRVRLVAWSEKRPTIFTFANRLPAQPADWRQWFAGIVLCPGLIKVPTNETENHFVIGRTLIFFGRTHSSRAAFQDCDGLLHPWYTASLTPLLGLALTMNHFNPIG